MLCASRLLTRYCCKRCTDAKATKNSGDRITATFNAWDPAVLGRMDDFVSEEFRFVVTRKAAIYRNVINRVADGFLRGEGLLGYFEVSWKGVLRNGAQTLSFVRISSQPPCETKGLLGAGCRRRSDPKLRAHVRPFGISQQPSIGSRGFTRFLLYRYAECRHHLVFECA